MVETSLNGNSWGNPAPLAWSRMGRRRGQGSLLGVTLAVEPRGRLAASGHVLWSLWTFPFYSTPSCLGIMCLVESPKKHLVIGNLMLRFLFWSPYFSEMKTEEPTFYCISCCKLDLTFHSSVANEVMFVFILQMRKQVQRGSLQTFGVQNASFFLFFLQTKKCSVLKRAGES